MKHIRLLIAAGLMATGLTTASVAVQMSPAASDVVPVVQPAEQADAQLTGCSKGTSGKQGWSLCTISTANYPYTTQHVVVVICKKWSWLGGDSFQLAGSWAGRNQYSLVNCPTYYNATSPVIWFR